MPVGLSEHRHLTQEEKDRILRRWEGERHGVAPLGKEAGHGYPDHMIVPWCDRLNKLPGVCTVQSCAGHSHRDGSRSSGQIWLRLSAPLAELFHQEALDLATDTRHIERLSLIYQPTDGQVVAIVFAGAERGMLEESMERIVAFFQRLSDRLIWTD